MYDKSMEVTNQKRSGSDLADDIAWLQVSHRFDELLHGAIIVALEIQVITISPIYIGNSSVVNSLCPGEFNCDEELGPAEKEVQFLRHRLFL
jgi:hypothetical protein